MTADGTGIMAGIEAPQLPAVSLVRASTLQIEPIRWLWDGWLARGKLHVLAGAPGAGKTTIACALAATVTSGGRWPDGSRAKPGRVIVWSGEDDPRDTLAPRLKAAGADLDLVLFVGGVANGLERRAFDPGSDVELLRAAIGDAGGADLVLVDPVINAVVGDSHKASDVRRSLQPLADLAMATDCALLGISHFGKGGAGRDPLERVIGSQAFGAFARIVLAAAKRADPDAGGAERLLCRIKSNIGPDDGGFGFDLLQGDLAGHPGVIASSVAWAGSLHGDARELLADAERAEEIDDTRAPQTAKAKEWLRDLLADGPVAKTEIDRLANAAGVSGGTLRRAKRELGVDARKRYAGGWYWSLSEQDDHAAPPDHLERLDCLDHLASKNHKQDAQGAQDEQGANGPSGDHLTCQRCAGEGCKWCRA